MDLGKLDRRGLRRRFRREGEFRLSVRICIFIGIGRN
jgi:hypothetical protein